MSRSTSALLFSGVVLSLAGSAAAQSYSGQQILYTVCEPVNQSAISGYPALEHQVSQKLCTAFCSAPPFQVTASSNEVRWERYADCGALAATCRVSGVQLTAAPCGGGAGGNTLMNQVLEANDVVFTSLSSPQATGPLAQPISINVEFRGRVAAGPACAGLGAHVGICVGADSGCKLSGNLDWNGTAGVGASGLAGYPGDGSLALLTSGTFSASLQVPKAIRLQLDTSASGILCESFNPTSTLIRAEAMLSLPRTGPVFNLPPDVTCNSAQLCIVDNQWVPPAPASAVAVGTPCTGSNGQPVVLAPVGLPHFGNASFAVTLSGPPDGTPALLYLAFGTADVPFQLPGSCAIFLDLASLLPLIASGATPFGRVLVLGGAATFPLPAPLSAALFGLSFDLQGAAFDPPMPLGITTSNALGLVIGS